jgi:hypothetical protein
MLRLLIGFMVFIFCYCDPFYQKKADHLYLVTMNQSTPGIIAGLQKTGHVSSWSFLKICLRAVPIAE